MIAPSTSPHLRSSRFARSSSTTRASMGHRPGPHPLVDLDALSRTAEGIRRDAELPPDPRAHLTPATAVVDGLPVRPFTRRLSARRWEFTALPGRDADGLHWSVTLSPKNRVGAASEVCS